jgi:AcrR family transcriptional regulator
MLRLVVEQGIQNTPMSQLAKEAGVAAGTIYHHFPSKEFLINELYLDSKEAFGKAIMVNFTQDKSYREKFEIVARNIYDFYVDHEINFLFSEQISRSTLITAENRRLGELNYMPILEFLELGIKLKELRGMEVELMAQLIYSNISAALHLHLSDCLIMTEERLKTVIASSWDGIKYKL